MLDDRRLAVKNITLLVSIPESHLGQRGLRIDRGIGSLDGILLLAGLVGWGIALRGMTTKDPRVQRVSCPPRPETSHLCKDRSPLPCAILCML